MLRTAVRLGVWLSISFALMADTAHAGRTDVVTTGRTIPPPGMSRSVGSLANPRAGRGVAFTLGATPNPASCGTAVTFTAMLAGATGRVAFIESGDTLGTDTLNASGNASVVIDTLVPGTHSVIASYAGDSTHAAALSNTVDEVVNALPVTVTLTSGVNPSACGSSVNLTATVNPITAGTVAILEGNTVLDSALVDTSGVATVTLTRLLAGSHRIVARFSGAPCSNGFSDTLTQEVQHAPTSIALTSDPNPSSCGSTATFTATVTPVGGTGVVTFREGATTLGQDTLSTEGTATLALRSLAVGAHDITASYAGDSCYAASVSTPLAQTVSLGASAITLSSSPNPSICGGTVTLQALVSPPGATGTVTFFEGATTLGAAALEANGQATLDLTGVAGGSHVYTASYSGDSCAAGSASLPFTHVVNPAPSTVTLTSTPNPTACHEQVTLTATVVPGAVGGVTFLDDSTSVGSASLDANGQASITINSLGAGTHNLFAAYAGDSCHAAARSDTLKQVVNPLESAVTLVSNPSTAMCGTQVILTATVAPSSAGGTVAFTEGPDTLGTAGVGEGGITTLPVTLHAGPHAIVARYLGDGCYRPDSSAAVIVTITGESSSVSLAVDQTPVTCGTTVTFTATVTPAVATGTVTFAAGDTILGTTTVDANGQAALTVALAAGAHDVMARYGGDLCHLSSTSSSVPVLVSLAPSSVTLTSNLNPSHFGESVRLTANVTPSTAGGEVTFRDGTTTIGSVPVGVNGQAILLDDSLSIGTHSLTAVYSGDSCRAGSTSETVEQVVGVAPTTIVWTSDGAPARFGAPLLLSVLVSPAGATGSVTFTADDTLALGQAPLDSLGNASIVATGLSVGSHSIRARYTGDATHDTSSIVYTQVIVPDVPPIVTVIYPNGGETLHPNDPVTLRWSATDDQGVESVSLYLSRDNGATYETIATDIPNTGAYDWTVTYPGTNTGSVEAFTAVFKVVARDSAGQTAADTSDAPFSIFDMNTAVVVTRLDAETTDDGVRIVWGLSDPGRFATISLERSSATVGPWLAVEADPQRQGELTVVTDRTAEAGRHYWYRLVGTTPAGARAVFGPIQGTAGVPRAFALAAAWPNPTRGALRTVFAVPRESRVRLDLLDLQGRVVSQLVAGVYRPGRYQVSWDGVGDHGAPRAGLYFLRLEAPGKTLTQRVVIR